MLTINYEEDGCPMCGDKGWVASKFGDCVEFELCHLCDGVGPHIFCDRELQQFNKGTEISKMIEQNVVEKKRVPQNTLVISLPGGDLGTDIKRALKELSDTNHRSLSNQVSLILMEYLKVENLL